MSGAAPVVDKSAGQFFDTLTGFDEIAIKREFGAPITDLSKKEPTTWMRALVFIHRKRAGEPDPKQAALAMTLGEVQAYFVVEDEGGGSEPGEAS